MVRKHPQRSLEGGLPIREDGKYPSWCILERAERGGGKAMHVGAMEDMMRSWDPKKAP